MKMISRLAKAITGNAEVEKRKGGVHVSRPVLNGQQWHDWAVKWGVPDPLAADDLHVTILYSKVDVKMIPDKTVRSIYIGPGYGDAACFAQFGPNADVLVVCFSDWDLWNRHWNFLANGGESTWPTYRPHMSISKATKDFELSDEALADAPLYINLGGEVYADLKEPEPDDQVTDGAEEQEDGDDVLIIIIEKAAKAAQALVTKSLAEPGSLQLSAMDIYALDDIAKSRPIQKGVLRRIAKAEWAPGAIKELDGAQVERVQKSVDVVINMGGALSGPVQKATGRESSVFKTEEDRHLIWSIASVSTVKGELFHDGEDTISTRALEEFTIDLMKNSRAGKFDHEGEACNHIVQALVLSEELQKALGIDLGMECLVTCTEVHPDRWAEVKDGTWCQSIAGTFYYYEDEAVA